MSIVIISFTPFALENQPLNEKPRKQKRVKKQKGTIKQKKIEDSEEENGCPFCINFTVEEPNILKMCEECWLKSPYSMNI